MPFLFYSLAGLARLCCTPNLRLTYARHTAPVWEPAMTDFAILTAPLCVSACRFVTKKGWLSGQTRQSRNF